MSREVPSPRALLGPLFVDVLSRIDIAGGVRAALSRVTGTRDRVRVVAVGKAAPAMMRGALEVCPRADVALVVVPDGVACDRLSPRVRVVRASHPLPDGRSVVAADEAVRAVRSASGDLVVALLSGGASSLLCAPYVVDLAEKRALLRTLLHSGADIRAMNTVRRHVSRVKGGGLARAAAPAKVLTLLVGDVLEGAPYDIGSGPTAWDPTTRDDARAVLRRYAPAFAGLPLRESLKPFELAARRLRVRSVLGPDDLAHAVSTSLAVVGFEVRLLPSSGASVETLALEYSALARDLAPGTAVVRAAEPTVVVSVASPGRGGRSSHLAALVGPGLPAGVAFLAGASDGVDGGSDAAGACVDAEALRSLHSGDLPEAIALFSTADVHASAGTAIETGPTGLNLADVHVLARSGPTTGR